MPSILYDHAGAEAAGRALEASLRWGERGNEARARALLADVHEAFRGLAREDRYREALAIAECEKATDMS
jgi:hypothetical protein